MSIISQNLFILSLFKSPVIKVYQTLFCKVNLVMFVAYAFDSDVKQQLTNEDAV